MPNYRRVRHAGGCYFFTVNLANRQKTLLTDHITILRSVFQYVSKHHPCTINAIVILPDHLHTIWTLPANDKNYSQRWSLIKSGFSRQLAAAETICRSRQRKGERGIWQRRFWEHTIQSETDYRNHVDYIHINPVKHGLVQRVADWRYSSFHQFVRRGVYPADWTGAGKKISGKFGER